MCKVWSGSVHSPHFLFITYIHTYLQTFTHIYRLRSDHIKEFLLPSYHEIKESRPNQFVKTVSNEPTVVHLIVITFHWLHSHKIHV
ncbi:hypothetical protein Y032_0381g360 [Ancylostoma ceylanicum]|uniref:Uncharacterized protein n=1 Tax=Ancylostoma ceylanicum TaxID=53326 RepID=A0A016RT90_9BILA|nr:hypothetical protein Y032_0381g360 [Ancylostoma ceylanicum]